VTTLARERSRHDLGAPPFHLQILGPLRMWRDGVEVDAGARMQRRMLALLLARDGNPVCTSGLVDLLWGDEPPASAVNTVHKYVGTLRRSFEPDLVPRAPGRWLVRHGPGYRFNTDAKVLDLSAFRRLAAAARLSLADGDDTTALNRRVEALRLWHGPAGDGLAETPAAQTIFATLDREYLDTAVEAAQLARHQNCPRLVIDLLWHAATVGPLHEPVHAELVANLALAGRRSEALAVYHTVRDRLNGELGIEPSPPLQRAYHDMG
jgi:DNA-binding SARP family transcriptional activator